MPVFIIHVTEDYFKDGEVKLEATDAESAQKLFDEMHTNDLYRLYKLVEWEDELIRVKGSFQQNCDDPQEL